MLRGDPERGLGRKTPCARRGDAAAIDEQLNMHRSRCGPTRVRIEARPREGLRRRTLHARGSALTFDVPAHELLPVDALSFLPAFARP